MDRPYVKDREKETDFINIVVWNKIGENAAKYLDKGRQCAVEGRLQIRSYDTDKGEKRWVTEVVAERVEFIGSSGNESKKGSDTSFGTEVVFDDNEVPF